jgi:DNA-binding SARP family transcriptional activator
VASQLAISLLGPVDIRLGDRPLTVDTRKAIALLAYLAVTRRPASRDTLTALLWPDADDTDGRGALRRTLSVLKTALQGVGLSIDRSAAALRDDELDVDVTRFRAALAAARDHRHDPDQRCDRCLSALEAGAALDRGEFMAGFTLRDSPPFDEWQLAEGEAHRRELAGLLERLARAHAASGQWDAAIAAGRRWLELDPLHEPAHRLLMTLHARAGEAAAAIHQYRDCVRILDTELGVAPLAETTALYEAIRTGGAPQSVRPTEREAVASPPASRSPALVGRSGDLQALMEAYANTGPDGRVAIVEGEAGVGKTHLLMAFAERVGAAGGSVLSARAFPGESGVAYGPLVEVIRSGMAARDAPPTLVDVVAEVARIVPIPGVAAPARPVMGDPFGRARLLDALSILLPSLVEGRRPGAIVLDDLHLADTSTVDAIAYLARRLVSRPVCLVVSWRREEMTEAARARLIEAAAVAGPPGLVSLGRLEREWVAELAAWILGRELSPGEVDNLFDESEGLPLYVVEAMAEPAGLGGTPVGVRRLLLSRIDSVSEIGAQILAAASVIGRSFTLRAVRTASGRSEDETVDGIEELMRRGLVRETGSIHGDVGYDFTHGRLREVAYEELSLARRRLIHGRVADALAGSPPSETASEGMRWSRVAQHASLAGRSAQAAEAHRRAGDYQRAAFANVEAAEHYEAALGLGHPAVAELHELLGELSTLRGDYAGAIAHLEAAAANDLATNDGRAATIEHRLALVHARRGDWQRAASHADVASAGTTDPTRRSMVLADRSAIAIHSGDLDAAVDFARRALDLASDGSDPVARAAAEHIAGVAARRRGDERAAERHLERAVGLSRGLDDLGLRISALNSMAIVASERGDRERAIELTSEALESCARLGDRHRQAALENNLADLFHATGREEEAMAHLKRAVTLFAHIDSRPGELAPEIWKLVEW